MFDNELVRVLIVADRSTTRARLEKLLAFAMEMEVIAHAGSGPEAIEQAEALHPDLVLMDILLPGLDGIAATKAIRSNDPSIKVVLVCDHSDPDTIRRATEAGAGALLVRPLDVDHLHATMRRVYREG